jgi:hypothetical protein
MLVAKWQNNGDFEWSPTYSRMEQPSVLDARSALAPGKKKAYGFGYHSVGRPDPKVKAALAAL